MRKGRELQDLKSRLNRINPIDQYRNQIFLDYIEKKKIRKFQALDTYIGSGGFVGTNYGANAQFPSPSINPIIPPIPPIVVVEYITTEDGLFNIIDENGVDKLIK